MDDHSPSGEALEATDPALMLPAPPTGPGIDHAVVRQQIARNLFGVHMEAPRLGRFRVLELLGAGGMGEVYTAFDKELDRRVAVKVLRAAATAGPEEHARLQREAQAMARLSHPNVVQIYEVGVHDGRIFIAMEFVKGSTLKQWLAAEQHSWQEILAVFEQAGRGLHAAHSAGVVHRDFKPDNVLVGADGRVRVADFGLAHGEARTPEDIDPATSHLDILAVPLTQRGTMMGTPAYMSPEQYDGSPTDPCSDQFSFCVALYEALYRQRPFVGSTLVELAVAVHGGVPPEPPGDSPVPAWAYRAIATGLAPNPGHRHGSMEVLLAELSREPPTPRDPWRWLAVALSLVMVLGGAALVLSTRERAASPAELAAVARLTAQARDAAGRAHWVYPSAADPQDTAILRIVALEALDGPARARALTQARALRHAIADDLAALGDASWEQARAYARDFYAQALVFRPDHPEARERGGFTPGELADLREKATHATFSARELDAVEPLLVLASHDPEARKRWLRDYEQAHANPRPAAAATPEPAAPRRDEAPRAPPIPELPRGKVATHATPRPPATGPAAPEPAAPEPSRPAEDPVRAEVLVGEAEAARRRGALSEARRLFHQALAAHPRSVGALSGLSNLAFDEGDYGQAVDYGERAVKLASKDPAYRLRLGDAYFKVLRFGEARDQYKVAAELGHPRAQERLDKLQDKLGAP